MEAGGEEVVDYCALARAGRVLVVGDGNYEFSLSLARVADEDEGSPWLTASALDEAPVDGAAAARAAALAALGAEVVHGVDGRRLEAWFGGRSFDAIVFNFPYVVVTGRRPQIDDNRALLRAFFASAAPLLAAGGRAVVALARGQGGTAVDEADRRDHYGNSWRVVDAAAAAGLVCAAAGRPAFPAGYTPGGYRGAPDDAGRAIAEAYRGGAVAHVFAREEDEASSVHAVAHAHDLSFWVPDAASPVAFLDLARRVAAGRGADLRSAARVDAYACAKTGKTAMTFRLVVATGARAVSREASCDVASACCDEARRALAFEPRSYVAAAT